MTRYLEEAIQSGYSEAFCRMLYNYGLWSRGSGIQGYFHGLFHTETYTIDDESALIVDKAVMELKKRQPKLYMLFHMYYVKGMNEYEICSYLRRHAAKKRIFRPKKTNVFAVEHAMEGALKYLNASAVSDLIVHSEKLVLGYLAK